MKDILKTLAQKIEKHYDYDNLLRSEDFYLLIAKHEGEDFFIDPIDIEKEWIEFKKFHRMIHTGLHPTDVRNLGGDYDF